MKARPILFSGPMVRALLDGRKQQTRRIVKNPDYLGCLTGDCDHDHKNDCAVSLVAECPYGQRGHLLWVRETFQLPGNLDAWPAAKIDRRVPCWYSADGGKVNKTNAGTPGRTRSSRFMPRRFSRLTLRITDVRVQRLRDISEKDALAEGCDEYKDEFIYVCAPGPYRSHFYDIWKSINGPKSWATNPWVWALTFEVLHENVDAVLKRLEAAT